MFGPVSIDQWKNGGRNSKVATSQPATQPAELEDIAGWKPKIEPEKQRKARQLYQKGSWHLLRGDYAVAAERFREALAEDPNMFVALNDLAGIHYLQKDYRGAVDLYAKILDKDAKQADALRGSFLAYVAQRQYPQSRTMLKRLLEVDEKDAEAWVDLGEVLFMMGDRRAARARWQHALTIENAPTAVLNRAKRHLRDYSEPTETEVSTSERK
jgi:tetratricopeptide (TPR) repeat protein